MGDIVASDRQDDKLLTLALEKGVDTDKLEKLIDLRNKEIARQSKAAYDTHFAEMQRDFVPVGKSREVMSEDGRRVLYSFCPLEDILTAYQPIITRHGFSFRWSEESLDNGMKRIWCIVAGYGHEERSYVDIPIQVGTKFTNTIQQRGVSTSYGKIYSFMNAFGVIIAGEDNDARPTEEGSTSYPFREESGGTVSGNNESKGPRPPTGHLGRGSRNLTDAGPMTFQRFIEIINEVVPSADRPGWMKKAQGGKDPALLAKLAGEIRTAYGAGSAAPDTPAPENAQGAEQPATDADQARYQIVEYITHLVPAGERGSWLTRLESIEHKLEPLASFYIELQTQYGDPGLFEE